jgi:transposase
MAADELLLHARGKALIGDTGYDSDRYRKAVRCRGMKPVIPAHPTRKYRNPRIPQALYRQRYRVECFFHDIKRFRAIATRYDKSARNFLANIHVACALMWLTSRDTP